MAAATETIRKYATFGDVNFVAVKITSLANTNSLDTGLDVVVAWGVTQEAGAGVVTGSVSGGTITFVVETTNNAWVWAVGY
jgi:hypothetical protein